MRTRVIIEFRHRTEREGLGTLGWLIPTVIDVLRTSPLPLTVRIERDPPKS